MNPTDEKPIDSLERPDAPVGVEEIAWIVRRRSSHDVGCAFDSGLSPRILRRFVEMLETGKAGELISRVK